MLYARSIILWVLLLGSANAVAWEPQYGPVLQDFGPWVPVESGIRAPEGHDYRMVFDVSTVPEATDARSRHLESAARFINMHVAAGVPLEDLEVVVVMHGSAVRSALDADAYQGRYSTENPDAGLIQALSEAGVRFYLCGQSAAYHEVAGEDLLPEIRMALSAMTINVWFQNEGYAIIAY